MQIAADSIDHSVKRQAILAGAGIFIATILFIFGRTTEPKKAAVPTPRPAVQTFNAEEFIQKEKQKLTASQAVYLAALETNSSRGEPSSQQFEAFTKIANFWKDSVRSFEPYAYYISKAAKLDNSEKNLTFAAQLFLSSLRGEQDEAKLNWEADEAIGLFEKAIVLNPANEDLKIGLGSSYVFGKGRSGDAQQTMKGVQELLGVVRRDSNNMKAQLVLGVGGSLSGQYDKAIARLLKVVERDPTNAEAVAFLADSYAGKGDKLEAIRWYTISKRLINDPHYTKEVDERIRTLQ